MVFTLCSVYISFAFHSVGQLHIVYTNTVMPLEHVCCISFDADHTFVWWAGRVVWLLLTWTGKCSDLGHQPACHWDTWVGTWVNWWGRCGLGCCYRELQNIMVSITQQLMSYLCNSPEWGGPSRGIFLGFAHMVSALSTWVELGHSWLEGR